MKKILLIEDNPDMRENTAEILELANYQVTTAENGKYGVELAQSNPPDLVICDVMMPELDGYGVLYLLSKNTKTAGIPFIFLTAKADRTDFRKGMDMGADDYITKPFDDEELLNAVEGRLKKSEILKKDFASNIDGLDQFLAEASDRTELENMGKNRKIRKFKKKETIYHEDNVPNGLFFISKGKVKCYKTNEDGKEYIVSLNKAGDFIGFMALLENTNYTETATALEDCELCFIPKDEFFNLLNYNRDIASKFIKMLSNNLRETEERLLHLAYNTVRQRVAEALIMLQSRYQEKGQDQFDMSITREDLANIVGTSTESVIRTLADFKDEGMVEIRGRNIKILNDKRLIAIKNGFY